MNKSGFTLLELSIVLVIIGLIIGGITVGQELIKQAEIQRTATDLQKINTAVQTFFLKYNSSPGDFNKAADYWGTLCMTPATNCNGNNNAAIETISEKYLAWRHLNLAQVYPGDLSGTHTGGVCMAGANVPAAPFGGVYHFNHVKGGVIWQNTTTAIQWGRGSTCADDAVVSPALANSLDLKLDDGVPEKGSLRSYAGTGPTNCTINTPPEYNVASNLDECRVFYGVRNTF
jgi:prepilin-type N-terminal cleavage/methylation domain-containing protein